MKMKIKVKIVGDKEKEIEIESNSKISKILKKLEINPETVIVKKGDLVVPLEEKIKKGEEIKIIKVVSGG